MFSSLTLALALFSATALSTPVGATDLSRVRAPSIDSTISRVEGLVWDSAAQQVANRHGLSLVNVTWEDTARTKESVWGPNISDMTIGVRDSQGLLHPMPVLRFDNYTDKTVDIEPARFLLSVGNERGRGLRAVTLEDVLQDTREYLHDAGSWDGEEEDLWERRDSAGVIVSAQAALLPVPRQGEATFTPVIYNYQSYPDNPAVLTIVATREGTSIQVVENDSGYMSDVLFFNADGERAPFTAVRLSDHLSAQPGGNTAAAQEAAEGSNVVLVIQVPLEQKQAQQGWFGLGDIDMAAPAAEAAAAPSARSSDMENAVIGHGEAEGPFAEIDGLSIKRDSRYPVRVTVQFYKATTTGTLTDEDVAAIRAEIDAVYGDPAFVSSLVVDGNTGRSTEWTSQPTETASWARPAWEWLKAF